MYKKILPLLVTIAIFVPLVSVVAQTSTTTGDTTQAASDGQNSVSSGQVAEARVIKILNQKDLKRDNGDIVEQQNIQLKILTGPMKDQVVTYEGISDVEVVNASTYKVGDRVMISYDTDENGKYEFFILDYVRRPTLIILLCIFSITVLAVGGWKGLKAILSLVISFFAIMKILVPAVLHGFNPIFIGIIVSFLILLAIIYLTEGFNKRAHIAVISILISLLVTALLAVIFDNLAHLTGLSEEAAYIIEIAKHPIDFGGLLLAAIIIGTLGVLDDVAVGQVEAVAQIRKANPTLGTWKAFAMAMEIGKAHLGAIINTLFLAYAGASLPLLLLFSLHQPPFMSYAQVINNEDIATEIIRTFVGVVGLCLAVPITTILAVKYLYKEEK